MTDATDATDAPEATDSEEPEQKKYDPCHHAMLAYCAYKGDSFLWNDWREYKYSAWLNHDGTKPDGARLAGATLIGANLAGADLGEAHLEGAKLWGVHLEGANLYGVHLEGAMLGSIHFEIDQLFSVHLEGARLSIAHLEGAMLYGVHLEGAMLRYARFEGAILNGVQLEGAILRGANLEGTIIDNTDLRSTLLPFVHVDSKTIISSCRVDVKTNFTGAGLDAAMIGPELKTALKNNIRRDHWQKWFQGGNQMAKALKTFFVRPFWWMTDYGSSSSRIIYTFLGLSVLFGGTYFGLDLAGFGIIDSLSVAGMPWYHTLLRSLYFSVVTMTTLGFGDLYALEKSYLGHVLLMLQVIIGYVILGALVTRLGILFTTEAPAVKPAPEPTPEEREKWERWARQLKRDRKERWLREQERRKRLNQAR